MELGRFDMAYSVLLPCIFHVYLHAEDHARLAGVLDLITEDARRALCARVAELNRKPRFKAFGRSRNAAKEYRIAAADWVIQFFPDTENGVPLGEVEVHSDLNEI